MISGRHVLLMLDFDGTLARLRPTSEQAFLPARTKALLEKLAANPGITLAVISGREIGNVRRKTDIPGIIYAGTHGLRIEGNGIKLAKTIPAKTLRVLRGFKRRLETAVADIPGARVEDKSISVLLHCRSNNAENLRRMDKIFRTLAHECGGRALHIKDGKKMLEALPSLDWNKGNAVLHILHEVRRRKSAHSVTAIYAGDDITDEDAFGALKNSGITVKIGGAAIPTAALYRAKGINENRRMLSLLLGQLKSQK
jgi:trehalose 6-phosphate phosphatase